MADLTKLSHKLAAISGSIEDSDASPLETAWRELHEETTLTKKSLRLRRQGKKYSFTDESLGREWTIYPFAFELIPTNAGGAGENGIQIDWEHEAWSWVDPHDVFDGEASECVPNLAKSLRRVYFETDLGFDAGKNLSAGIKMLQDDHHNGARVLAGNALLVLGDVAEVLQSRTAAEWWDDARMAAWHLWKNGRESMGAAILNVMICSLEILEREVLPSYEDLTQTQLENVIRTNLDAYGETRIPVNQHISRQFRSYLNEIFPINRPVRILTLSSSSTILTCLKDAIKSCDRDFDLRILESRPLFEGASMAANLAVEINAANTASNSRQHQIAVYTDACAGIASQDVDLVLLGADLISANGDVCNKTGSLAAVLCARHISPNVNVTVVADSEKVFPFEAPRSEENDESEVTVAWSGLTASQGAAAVLAPVGNITNPAMSIRNVYFEWVPSQFVTTYLLEKGGKNAADIEVMAGSVREKANRLFDDL